MAWASAWTTGGCPSPATTRLRAAVRVAGRSPTAATQRRLVRRRGAAPCTPARRPRPASGARPFDLARRAAAGGGRPSRRSASACSRRRTGGSSRSACSRPRGATRSRARSAGCPGPQARKSASSDEDHVGLVEAVLRLDVLAEGELRAGARGRRGSPGPTGASARRGSGASSSRICAASVGEVTVSVRSRSPAPPCTPAAPSSAARIAPRNAAHGRISPSCGDGLRAVGIVEAEHRRLARTTSVAPRLRRMFAGCLRPSSAGPCGSRRAGRWRRRRAASRWRRTAACPGRAPRAAGRRARSASAGWRVQAAEAGERERRAHQLQERRAARPDRLRCAGLRGNSLSRIRRNSRRRRRAPRGCARSAGDCAAAA